VSSSFGPGSTRQRTTVVLRDILEKYFNDSELRDLCFELQIDYENLPGNGKASKARELILFCERQGRTRDLAEACCRLRQIACNDLRTILALDQPGSGAPDVSQPALPPIQSIPVTDPQQQLPNGRKTQVPPTVIIGGLCVVIVIAIAIAGFTTGLPRLSGFGVPTTPSSISYPIRVQALATGDPISNAKVTIEVPDLAPIDEYTDSNGFTRVMLDSSRVGKRGKIIIEAVGYQRYIQEIDLVQSVLPDTIRMSPTP
jgi:hypothetical protein